MNATIFKTVYPAWATLKMKAASSSKMSVTNYKSTGINIPEIHNIQKILSVSLWTPQIPEATALHFKTDKLQSVWIML